MSSFARLGLIERELAGDDYPQIRDALANWWGGLGGDDGADHRMALVPRLFFDHFSNSSGTVSRRLCPDAPRPASSHRMVASMAIDQFSTRRSSRIDPSQVRSARPLTCHKPVRRGGGQPGAGAVEGQHLQGDTGDLVPSRDWMLTSQSSRNSRTASTCRKPGCCTLWCGVM
jgi:hypothetical protein